MVCGRFLILASFSIWIVLAEKNQDYQVATLCNRNSSQEIGRKKISGAVLTSGNEDSLDCTITFLTDSILQKFMLRFDELQLDCNDHLYIYDGSHAYGQYQADLSCRNNKRDVGTIYTRTNYVTLKFVTDGSGQIGNGFKLVLTAFKDKAMNSRDFRCSNNLCIDNGLSCDGVNHCGDNSDESSFAACRDDEASGIVLGVELSVFLATIEQLHNIFLLLHIFV